MQKIYKGMPDGAQAIEANFNELLPSEKVLWTGAAHLAEDQTISFPDISGYSRLILLFSYYTTGASAGPKNYCYHEKTVEVETIKKNLGAGHYFLFMPAVGIISAKYIYISNNKIAGSSTNTSTVDGYDYRHICLREMRAVK